MKAHTIYIGAYDESLTGQDIVMILEEAMSWANEDYRNCIEANGCNSKDSDGYKDKLKKLEGIFIMEEQPSPEDLAHENDNDTEEEPAGSGDES